MLKLSDAQKAAVLYAMVNYKVAGEYLAAGDPEAHRAWRALADDQLQAAGIPPVAELLAASRREVALARLFIKSVGAVRIEGAPL